MLNENDVFEWGDIHFENQLKSFHFKIKKEHTDEIRKVYGDKVCQVKVSDDVEMMEGTDLQEVKDMTFHNALFNHQGDLKNDQEGERNESSSILVLGCGNSRLGEDILHYYFDLNSTTKINAMSLPKVIQCDISTHVVNSMTKRYDGYIKKDKMSLLQDDATQLTLLQDESMDAVVDKGLIDALFCVDKGDMMQQVIKSAHRTLKVGKVFMFFSFSRPEFLLRHTQKCNNNNVLDDDNNSGKYQRKRLNAMDDNVNWSSVNVWEMDQIFMYRFVKGEENVKGRHTKKKLQRNKKSRKR